MIRLRTIFHASLILTMVFLVTGAEVADKCFEQLPVGCLISKTDVITSAQKDAIAKRLGIPLKKLSNTYLQIQGQPILVNIFETKTDAEAIKLYKIISKMKDHSAFCLIRGRKVIEFCDADASTAIKTAYELGFVKKPGEIRYLITAHVSTIEKADYMAFNKLFNVFLNTNTSNPSRESITQIETLSRGFTFGKSLVMRTQPELDGVTTYSLTPNPMKSEHQQHDRVVYSFDQCPRILGIPYVTLKANIVCNDTGVTSTVRKSDKSLLSATSFWPVDDPQVRTLAKKITSGKRTQEARVDAILSWLAPGKNIQFGGPVEGSRWGVKKVLAQQFGQCWDFSDCFVTLSRAAGIPSRQVGGWLYGTSGHIWAEVLIEGKGWKQFDPTGGGKLNCGIYHIPYFTTETGEMPILYFSIPQIEIAETEQK